MKRLREAKKPATASSTASAPSTASPMAEGLQIVFLVVSYVSISPGAGNSTKTFPILLNMAGRHLPCPDFVETLPLDDICAHPVPASPPVPATVSPNISPEERRNKYQNVKGLSETIELEATPEPSRSTGTSDKNDNTKVETDCSKKPKVKEQEKFTDSENEVGALMGLRGFGQGVKHAAVSLPNNNLQKNNEIVHKILSV